MIFLAQSLIIKPSSIIELCIKQSRDSGSVVAQECGSINLSFPVSFAEIRKGILQTVQRNYWSWLILQLAHVQQNNLIMLL